MYLNFMSLQFPLNCTFFGGEGASRIADLIQENNLNTMMETLGCFLSNETINIKKCYF